MNDKFKETLKKIEENISRGITPTSSSTDSPKNQPAGDPNCPYCGGLGYLRFDLPLNHPDFGKLQICECRRAEVSQRARQRLYSLSHLDELKHLTFENFESRGRIGLGQLQASSLEQAYNSAHAYSQKLEGWLLLIGGYGCGKTHLAAAIANSAVEQNIPTIFITVPDMLDALRFTYQSEEDTYSNRFEQIRQIPLLILDDFGTQNATAWAQEKLFQIMNYRYINRLPLVVTANVSLQEIEGRIRSRLQDPELVSIRQIYAPDYRRPLDDTGHHELSSLSLLADRTFGNFNLRKQEGLPGEHIANLDKIFKIAQEFAETPSGWLVFTGTYGCGKTHLAAAIANYRAAVGQPPLFVVIPDLLDHLRATFNPNSSVSLDRRFEEVRAAPLLVLDDLGTQSATPWAREKIYQLFNHRYNAKLPTIITTANSLNEIDARIRSRMLDTRLCRILAITAPPYTGK